jgi:hypothetical protein
MDYASMTSEQMTSLTDHLMQLSTFTLGQIKAAAYLDMYMSAICFLLFLGTTLFFSYAMNKYNDKGEDIKVIIMLFVALMAGVGTFMMMCAFLTSLHNFLYPLTCLLKVIK